MSNDIGMDVQALRMAADAVLKRGLSDKGLSELIEYSGDIAAIGLSFRLLFREIANHVNQRAA